MNPFFCFRQNGKTSCGFSIQKERNTTTMPWVYFKWKHGQGNQGKFKWLNICAWKFFDHIGTRYKCKYVNSWSSLLIPSFLLFLDIICGPVHHQCINAFERELLRLNNKVHFTISICLHYLLSILHGTVKKIFKGYYTHNSSNTPAEFSLVSFDRFFSLYSSHSDSVTSFFSILHSEGLYF